MSGNTATAGNTATDNTADDNTATDNTATEPVAGSGRFTLPPQADIRASAEIEPWCRAALDAGGDVEIVCDAVERVDAAVLQCIAALAASLAQAERHLELVGRSVAFTRAVDLLGFESALGGRPEPDHQPGLG